MIVFAFREDYSKAERHFEKALLFRPNLAEANLGLGNIHHCSGHIEEAESCYKAAINNNPFYLNAYLSLEKLYDMTDRPDDKSVIAKRALPLKPLKWDHTRVAR